MVIWVLGLMVQESPLWLARHSRTDKASKILARLEAAAGPAAARPQMVASTVPARVPATAGLSDLYKPPDLPLIEMFMVFNFCQAFGFYGFANWVPTLLVKKGITVTKSLEYSFIVAFAYPIAPLLASTFADRLERKWIICGACVAIILFGAAFSQLTAPVLLILSGVLLTAANMTMSYAYHTTRPKYFRPRSAPVPGLFDEPDQRDVLRFHRRRDAENRRRRLRPDHLGDDPDHPRDRGPQSPRARQAAGRVSFGRPLAETAAHLYFSRGFRGEVEPPCWTRPSRR